MILRGLGGVKLSTIVSARNSLSRASFSKSCRNSFPNEGYGDIICRPIVADFNGDLIDDRVVKCGNEWKIAITDHDQNITDFRIVEMDDSIISLPAYVYPGGIKYQDILSIYNHYKYQLGCGKGEECTIFNAKPPIGPHFNQCIKYWAPPPHYCWDK